MKIVNKTTNFMKTSYVIRFIIFGLILLLIPKLAEQGLLSNATVRIFGYVVIFTVVALGLNLLLGFSGLISLGTAGFMGLGGYLFVFISNNLYDGFIVAAILTMIICGAIGALIGMISLRVEGIYLAIATLFIGEIFLQIFRNVDWFTGGFSGLKFFHPLFKIFGNAYELTRDQTYVMMVFILVIVMILMYNLIHSRTGRALLAMSRSEHAAQAMGVSILKYRLIAFITATCLAALGGVMYISYFKFIDPSPWNLNRSLLIIAMVVVGGYKSIFGTAFGAFIIYAVPELYLKDIFSSNPEFSYIFAGGLIILVIMFYPNGAIYLIHDVRVLYHKYIYVKIYPYHQLWKKYREDKKSLQKENSVNPKEDFNAQLEKLKIDFKESVKQTRIHIKKQKELEKGGEVHE